MGFRLKPPPANPLELQGIFTFFPDREDTSLFSVQVTDEKLVGAEVFFSSVNELKYLCGVLYALEHGGVALRPVVQQHLNEEREMGVKTLEVIVLSGIAYHRGYDDYPMYPCTKMQRLLDKLQKLSELPSLICRRLRTEHGSAVSVKWTSPISLMPIDSLPDEAFSPRNRQERETSWLCAATKGADGSLVELPLNGEWSRYEIMKAHSRVAGCYRDAFGYKESRAPLDLGPPVIVRRNEVINHGGEIPISRELAYSD